jgi:hypothetical protein
MRLFTKNATPYAGFTALRMAGCCAMPHTPNDAMPRNQATQTGPNRAPMRAVPCRCSENSVPMTSRVNGTIQCASAGAATSRPSTAESTEIAGVITPSP